MRNLFIFIYRNYAFFFFLLLQSICIVLIVWNENYHQAAFQNLADEWVGRSYKAYNQVTEYLRLGDENSRLSKENARLRMLMPSSFYTDTSNVYSKTDSIHRQLYTYIPARVIETTTNRMKNYIMIDKGKNDGVAPRMAVISPDGIVGIVKNVSAHFATLYSVLHQEVTISGRVRQNGSRGTIRWDGGNPDYVILADITRMEKLRQGDTIYTSGVSRLFPDNVPIGTIDQFSLKPPGNFYDITVRLSTNFRRLDYVYVVNYMMHSESDSLMNRTLENDK
ncbi:MAG: rod shape-determining protein MreC [Chitinophagales bacterium]|nr:rod shape-determining protein MreC [Chitinophagales bacterium]